MASQRSSQPIHVALVWVCHRCCVGLLLTSSAVSVCLYMWLYSVYFIFCTIVNPTVPVAWLFLVIQFDLCMTECVCACVRVRVCVSASVCVCVCARVYQASYFLPRGDLWYEHVWVPSCVPILSFPEHCDNSGRTRTHRLNGRDKELLS